ncbi:hypothetical protein [Mesorhizobium sp. BH1-1-4]|uniref:hypothetical protein n=1 Tax=Mesorhizobium sp. BH1-1-4 TaxID=2876662 RepID=UPI001CD17571|nr:hypothetical protein [Mesorhizobium sp. BH1-1-4]MBZ9993146.1 hypothetical protein [Mesorhizobium sp. BH1-1-4]
MVASIASFENEDVVGSAASVQSFEIAAAFQNPAANAAAVREEAAKNMFRLTSGAELVRPFLESWTLLRESFMHSEKRTGEVVAISKSDFAGNASAKTLTSSTIGCTHRTICCGSFSACIAASPQISGNAATSAFPTQTLQRALSWKTSYASARKLSAPTTRDFGFCKPGDLGYRISALTQLSPTLAIWRFFGRNWKC